MERGHTKGRLSFHRMGRPPGPSNSLYASCTLLYTLVLNAPYFQSLRHQGYPSSNRHHNHDPYRHIHGHGCPRNHLSIDHVHTATTITATTAKPNRSSDHIKISRNALQIRVQAPNGIITPATSTTVRVFSGGCVSSVYPSKQISGIHHRIAVCDRCEPTRHSAGSVGWVLVADQDLLPKQPCQRRRSSRLHCGDCHPTGNTPVPVIRTTAAPWRW
nr:hypothetical protein Iba_chr09eCG12990 [Ipomoea batatas]